ncbi:hypothetical protein [Maribacter stanieri]|uniref:Uncharacterized protein n=1 Tax=Maribacter stanieri TaxID=440514 RepID=A0A1I6HY13_9FLAO|nr:hypothetical protein [Maribacter stanieri]SFR59317.1 hypothetical protein SAMN04488010_0899 [Maribacter stanieri]
MNDILKQFGVAIPILTGFLIICGYMNLWIVYSHFGIRINEYLEIKEILTLFMPDILKYFLMIVIGIVGGLIFTRHIGNKTSTDYDKLSSLPFWNRLIIHVKKTSFLFPLAVLILIFFIIPHDFIFDISGHKPREKFEMTFLLLYPVVIFWTIIWEEISIYLVTEQKIKNHSYFSILSYVLMFFIWGSISSAIKDIGYSKVGKYQVEFEYLNKEYSTTSSILYIGQTQNFLFLHDSVKGSNKIFERKNIQNLEVKKVEGYD